jgi:hypothetical protein
MFNEVPLLLDIDCVVHPVGSRPSDWMSCKGAFEQWVRRYSNLRLVFSSSRRQLYPLKVLQGHSSADVGARIIGATPRITDARPQRRHREILAWLARNRAVNAVWFALDDSAYEFPAQCPQLVSCVSARGFDDEVAAELDRRLAQTDTGKLAP